ncbi:MAG: hypothetical protein ACTSV7_14370 [Candidatus Baldrarchaeia archaeon]
MNTQNLWILTEERPKKEVVNLILLKMARDMHLQISKVALKIVPINQNNRFSFIYEVVGPNIESIDKILIKVVSGYSSFVDYLLFIQDNEPDPTSVPLYAIEETKTSDYESRNTAVYQRCTKFVYVDFYYPSCKKIMLYNIKIGAEKRPTDSNVFGSRMLMTLGVEILGRKLDQSVFKGFDSIEELIRFKNSMRSAHTGDVPISIKKYDDKITVSGRLFKSGGLSHDPNIGALSIISKTIRDLGWKKDIIITKHGLEQKHIKPNNKFIKIAYYLDLKIDGLYVPKAELRDRYWHYEHASEKIVTILYHLLCEDLNGVDVIYENHAGCERGYFMTPAGDYLAIKKYVRGIKERGIISLPDLIVCDHNKKQVVEIEGEKADNYHKGVSQLNDFGAIERYYIKVYYPEYEIIRGISLFGGLSQLRNAPHLMSHLNSNGVITLSDNSPQVIKKAFEMGAAR